MAAESGKASCLEIERKILAYKRHDPFMPYARHLQKFWSRKCWRCLGFEHVLQWTVDRYPKNRYWPYQLVKIANRLGTSLDDTQIHAMGISRAYELARITPRGAAPDPEFVKNALALPYNRFHILVETRRLGGAAVEFGEYLNPPFRGLTFAPTNELGVVLLFGMVARELGFMVEGVQSKFPDCKAKERVPGRAGRWRDARIEFEYKCSNFNHEPNGADVVVCWENDWPECPVRRVIELKSKIKDLPNPPELAEQTEFRASAKRRDRS